MKHVMLLTAVLGALVAAPATPRAGVALISSERCVVAIDGPVLPVGTKLTVVTDGPPQEARPGWIKRALPESEDLGQHSIAGPYYDCECSLPAPRMLQVAVVIVGEPKARRVGGAVSFHVGTQYLDVRARTCTSTEGLHLTLWSGPVLQGARLWHKYYYLGYDVEPSCRPEDYRDGG